MFWDDSLAIYREQAESAQLEAIKYNSPDIMRWHKSAATYYFIPFKQQILLYQDNT